MRETRPSPEGRSAAARPVLGLLQDGATHRRKYDPPQLIEWGTLAQLTRGGSGVDYDIDNGATKAV